MVLAFWSLIINDIFYLVSWTHVLNVSTGTRWDRLTWLFFIMASCVVDRWFQVLGWEFESELSIAPWLAPATVKVHRPDLTGAFWLSVPVSLSPAWLSGVGGLVSHLLSLALGVLMNVYVSMYVLRYGHLRLYIKHSTHLVNVCKYINLG